MLFSFFKNIFSKDVQTQTSPTKTIGEMQKQPLSEWGALGDTTVFEGLEFHATLQLRTPLEILKHHREVYTGRDIAPRYINEEWQGIWLAKHKEEYDLFTDHGCASDVGLVNDKIYLKFLIPFREIIERNEGVDKKIELLESRAKENSDFKLFWEKHKKIDQDFPHSFFYKQLTAIEGIGNKTAKILYEHGFKSIEEIKSATDEKLLSVKGIGKSLIVKIRLA